MLGASLLITGYTHKFSVDVNCLYIHCEYSNSPFWKSTFLSFGLEIFYKVNY